MNVQLLSKHFPELNGLSDTERSSILQRAHERAYAPERKLYHWRRNVVSLVCITALALFIALIAGPALSISRPTTGAIIMVVVLPAFMVIRQRQYIGQLRPEVQAITRDRL